MSIFLFILSILQTIYQLIYHTFLCPRLRHFDNQWSNRTATSGECSAPLDKESNPDRNLDNQG